MYWNGYFVNSYYNDYFDLDGEAVAEITIGAYKGMYLGMYSPTHEKLY